MYMVICKDKGKIANEGLRLLISPGKRPRALRSVKGDGRPCQRFRVILPALAHLTIGRGHKMESRRAVELLFNPRYGPWAGWHWPRWPTDWHVHYVQISYPERPIRSPPRSTHHPPRHVTAVSIEVWVGQTSRL